jgi:predicted RNA-binding Zn-ribbon protein involved in translation (DUF1610 family)
MIKDKNTTIGYHCPQCGISILNTVNMFSFSSAGSNLIKLKCPCGASELTVTITKDKKFRLTVPCIVCPNAHSYSLSPHIFFERELFSFSCKFTALNICFIGKSPAVMEAMRKNEQELLETFAEYDDNFDSSDIKELTDIFDWDDEDFDEDELFDELFGAEEDWAERAEDLETVLGYKPGTGGFELIKNDNFNSDTDGDLDLSLYSDFKAYSTTAPENKKKAENIEADINNPDIKIKNYPVVMQILGTLSQFVQDKKIYCKCRNFDGAITMLDNHVHIQCKKCGSERYIKSTGTADIEYIAEIGELFLDYDD